MPRFYFDVREDSRILRDEDGLEFDSLDRAEREAAISAANIARDRLSNGDVREIAIEVRDEHGQRVLTVTVSLHVERVAPPPAAPAEARASHLP